jgi:hypothetical protein
VVEPYNPKCSFLFKKIATLAVPRGPCLRNPLSTTVEASSMAPAVFTPSLTVASALQGLWGLEGWPYIGTYLRGADDVPATGVPC